MIRPENQNAWIGSLTFFLGSVVLVTSLIFWIYIPGIGGGYIFDDLTSVTYFSDLAESPQHFWSYVFGERSGLLGRPISAASFALENILLDGSPETSKRISISLHAINTALVFWFASLVLGGYTCRYTLLLALLGACIWSFSPQKVSTVLYIVQRMAMLSSLFILVSLIAYFYARSCTGFPKFAAAVTCTLCLLFAPFAKENGILVLPLILLFEVFVISPAIARYASANVYLRAAVSGLSIMALLYILVGTLVALGFLYGYGDRAFTFSDRIQLLP